MLDNRSLHLKMQELCDCFVMTEPLKEMLLINKEQDKEEAGLKYLALTVLFAIENNAKKIKIIRSKDGSIKTVAKYHRAELPSPGKEVGNMIFEGIRGITHLEGEKGKTALALGIRDSSIEIDVKMEKEDGEEEVTLKFPSFK